MSETVIGCPWRSLFVEPMKNDGGKIRARDLRRLASLNAVAAVGIAALADKLAQCLGLGRLRLQHVITTHDAVAGFQVRLARLVLAKPPVTVLPIVENVNDAVWPNRLAAEAQDRHDGSPGGTRNGRAIAIAAVFVGPLLQVH